uniref:RVT_N domain-containing protein n=1 Tax=Heterorhabditis bacteriophora TaxID=37862 RepID=A0A1I7W9H0_HETBA
MARSGVSCSADELTTSRGSNGDTSKKLLQSRTGGAYMPRAKLKLMQKVSGKSGEQYQRVNWERIKKKIHELVNKINTTNLVQVAR